MLTGFSWLSEAGWEQCNGSLDSVKWGAFLDELTTVICLTATTH